MNDSLDCAHAKLDSLLLRRENASLIRARRVIEDRAADPGFDENR